MNTRPAGSTRGSRFGSFERWLIVVLLIGAVLRIAWVLYAARHPVGLADPAWYLMGATSIAEGDGYSLLNGEATAYYPVGYPAALSVVVWLGMHTPLTDDVPTAMGFVQVLMALVTIALVGLLGRRLVNARVGVIAAALLAVFPSQIFYTATLLSETLFSLLLVGALGVLVLGRDGGADGRAPLSWQRIGSAGLLLGLAVLTRPLALAVVPMAWFAWWIAGVGWRRALRDAAVLGVGIVVVVVPWTVRNTIRMGDVVVISTNTGDNLCIGHNPQADGAFGLFDWCLDGVDGRFTTRQELDRDRELTGRALRYAIEHPQRELPLLWLRTYHTFSTDDDGLWAVEGYGADPFIDAKTRNVLSTSANVFYGFVLVLAAIGLVLFWRRHDRARLTYLAFMAAMFVAPLPFFGDPRFKVPFTLLCVIPAAVAISAPWAARDREEPGSGGGDLVGQEERGLVDPGADARLG